MRGIIITNSPINKSLFPLTMPKDYLSILIVAIVIDDIIIEKKTGEYQKNTILLDVFMAAPNKKHSFFTHLIEVVVI